MACPPRADWDSPRPSFGHKEAERFSLEAPGFCPLCLGCLAGTTARQWEWGERGGSQAPWQLQDTRTSSAPSRAQAHRQRAPRLQLQTEKPLSVPSGGAESHSTWGSPAWTPDSTAPDLVFCLRNSKAWAQAQLRKFPGCKRAVLLPSPMLLGRHFPGRFRTPSHGILQGGGFRPRQCGNLWAQLPPGRPMMPISMIQSLG